MVLGMLLLLAESVLAKQSQEGSGSEGLLELRDGWDYRWGDVASTPDLVAVWTNAEVMDWKLAQTTYNPRGADEDVVWFRLRLPLELPDEPALVMTILFQSFDAYLDDKLIYQHGVLGPDPQNKYAFTTPHIIPLPEYAAGRMLYLRVYSGLETTIGIQHPVYIWSAGDKLLPTAPLRIPAFFLGVVVLFMGGVTLYLMIGQKKEGLPPLLGFSVFTLPIGSYFVNSSMLGQLLLDNPVLSYHLAVVVVFFPVGLLILHERLVGHGRSCTVRVLWGVHLVLAAAILVLDGFNMVSFLDFLPWFFLLLLCSLLVMLFTTFTAVRRGEQLAKIYAAGLFVIIGTGLHDFIFLGIEINPDAPSLSIFGILAFVLVLAYLTKHEHARKLKDYAGLLEERKVDSAQS